MKIRGKTKLIAKISQQNQNKYFKSLSSSSMKSKIKPYFKIALKLNIY
jgi:hypothetical protein